MTNHRAAAVVALTAAAALCASVPASAAATTPRGELVSAQSVQRLTARQVRAALAADGFSTVQVRYGVDAYRLTYRTISASGGPTTATGLLVLPRDGARQHRTVVYDHGTMSGADEAPSVDDNGRSDEGLEIGSAGFAAVAPDYLGLGRGPGAHPYLQLSTEVSATVDLVRAAAAFTHHRLDPDLLVTGFSQGGAAAMAVGQALQQHAVPGYRLAALAPISGPYDLRTAELPAIFDGTLDQRDSAFYLSYFLTAWNRLYHLYGSVSEVFRAPYDRTVAPLFDGRHDEPEIFAALPAPPQQLLTPRGLDLLRHPNPRLAAALAINDASCQGWTRGAPIHIYASHADEQVAITNAYQCQAQLADRGVLSDLVDVGPYGHLDSGRHGLAAAIDWFRSLR
ncbi:MAG: hypothetical protein J0H43_13475 [Actinobacteria bacterium]|nr:hypothetical protein [Actinomycetota bacterium]